MEDNMKKILITGGTGDVGRSLCKSLSESGYELLTSARHKPEGWPHPFEVLDITDLDKFVKLSRGVDTLVHLAGQREPDAGFDDLVEPNLRGSYNAFEAAHQAEVKRVIFASSVNASCGLVEEQPLADEVAFPSSLYGATKIFGEAVARYYSDKHELSCISLRMGWTLPLEESRALLSDPPMDSLFARKVYLSAEDFAQLVRLSIEAPDDLKFGVFNALSDNREKLLDISRARTILGYQPIHDAFAIVES
jgi:NAD+ dependent glucose-6-phosphate dehydrogenase